MESNRAPRLARGKRHASTQARHSAGHYFRSVNFDPVEANRCADDRYTKGVSWPNYHSGMNGDVQKVRAIEPIHPLLRRLDGSAIDTLPAHPHEGAIVVPGDSLDPTTARDLHDETLPGEGAQQAHFLLDVRAALLLDEDHPGNAGVLGQNSIRQPSTT